MKFAKLKLSLSQNIAIIARQPTRCGEVGFTKDQILFNAVEVAVHPDYGTITEGKNVFYVFDAALIRTDRKMFPPTSVDLRPICLPPL